jgi:benzoyl-CoA reductase/2-hydroxyglutaryl-CoA dehydratase subunit BcrC/BadD/HgdB
MKDYHQMWEELGIDLDAHDQLLTVLPPLFKDTILGQEKRPAKMSYFDNVFAEIHGKRIQELVEHKQMGGKVVGTFCTYVPEEIVLALGGACIGLCGGAELATEQVEAILPRNICALIKSSFGFKLAKLCPYFECCDLLVGETSCDGKKKYYEVLSEYAPVHVMELPQRKEERDRRLWQEEVRLLISRLEELTGNELERKVLEEAIEIVNAKRQALLRLAELRKSKPPVISGKDALLINQIAFYDEPRRFTARVEELCEELEQRVESGFNSPFSASPRILLSGCPMAIPNWKLPHILESSGAVIVMEELCTGIRYYRNLVDNHASNLDELIDHVADRYLEIDCAVFTPNNQRINNIRQLALDYQADGLVYYSLQFCDPYTIEAYRVKKMAEELGLPFLYIETDYSQEDTAQISTRVEAFLEMIEKKRLR